MKSVIYVAKNHMNCACIDGIPYSIALCLIGLASQIVCFNIKFIPLLITIPLKNVI